MDSNFTTVGPNLTTLMPPLTTMFAASMVSTLKTMTTPMETNLTTAESNSTALMESKQVECETTLPMLESNTSRPFVPRQPVYMGRVELIVHLVVVALLMVLITGGNIIVIVSVWAYKCLQKVRYMLLVNLAVADVLMGVIVCPATLIMYLASMTGVKHLIRFDVLCGFVAFTLNLSGAVSLFSMCGIALNSFIAVSKPLRYKVLVTQWKTAIFIAFTWVYALILCALLMYFGSKDVCNPPKLMTSTIAMIIKVHFLALLIIIAFAQTFVTIVAARHEKKINAELKLFNNVNDLAVAFKKERKATKSMSIMCALFLLCWIPRVTMSWVKLDGPPPTWYVPVIEGFIKLMYANSALNPLVYAFRMKTFGKAMVKVIKCNYKAHIDDD
ncbi:unnamed protein product [Owenia fusiformis]|uniref:Uncharacterized protein n=1 Tax=Owenia fusiformis TaxID=6347 RepID=A0A8J1Y1U4_OWEFU|nr:unnamed protein product [Owenia fusiformis]